MRWRVHLRAPQRNTWIKDTVVNAYTLDTATDFHASAGFFAGVIDMAENFLLLHTMLDVDKVTDTHCALTTLCASSKFLGLAVFISGIWSRQ